MDTYRLKELLESVAAGATSTGEALDRLRRMPFEDLGFVKIDHHRAIRQGAPETIFGSGKTPDQLVEIVSRLREHGSNVLVTRCSPEGAQAVLGAHPDMVHNTAARTLTLMQHATPPLEGYVAVACAGTSDLPVAEEAVETCAFIGAPVERVYDIGVAGIHRLFSRLDVLQKAQALVVCAGMEGALPSVVAGLVDKPVFAVPTSVGYGASFGGVAAMLAMLNSCASGVSIVNIDNGYGAGYLASMVLRIANGSDA
ncbi:MAG: 1-(5-phosphoribosyl)-5-amino-4-imidazole-carboxylate carboxylase [Candidatus Hydrogenedentota bacterium]